MKNLILSTDKLNAFEDCPRLYEYSHVKNLTSPVRAKYFTEGEFIHKILEIYYTDIMKSRKQDLNFYIEIARNLAITQFSGLLDHEEFEGIIKVFSEYYNFYDSNTSWKILEVEVPFAKVLLEDDKLDIRIIVRGKSDLIIETQGIKAGVDHKFLGRNMEMSDRDNQKLCYSWAFDLKDFFINSIGKQTSLKLEEKFKRIYFSYSQYQIDEWVENTINSALEIIRYYELGNFPIRYKSCINLFGKKCTFHDVCNTSPDNRAYKLSEFTVKEEYDLMRKE